MTQIPNSSQKTGNAVNIAESATNIIGTVSTAIASINDAKQRGVFTSNLQLLDNEQKSVLNKAILSANSEQERLAILKDTLTDLSKKRIDLLVSETSKQEKKDRRNTYIVASSFFIVAIGLLAVIIKRS
jgi:hypothetical protein